MYAPAIMLFYWENMSGYPAPFGGKTHIIVAAKQQIPLTDIVK